MKLQKVCWSFEAERGLAGAYGELTPRELAHMVDVHSCELWCVDDESWLVTGIENDDAGRLLFVWSFAGKELLNTSRAIIRICKRNHIDRVQFVCMKESVARLLHSLSPALKVVTGNGTRLYEIGVK